MVKMESRVKLGNDEKIKFVRPMKNVRWVEKACGSGEIYKLQKNLYFPHFLILYHFPLATKQALTNLHANTFLLFFFFSLENIAC